MWRKFENEKSKMVAFDVDSGDVPDWVQAEGSCPKRRHKRTVRANFGRSARVRRHSANRN